MAPEDENTTFITKNDIYYYKVMPFKLKNVGATYQRLVNKVFKDQIDKKNGSFCWWYAYKSFKEANYIKDLEKAFSTLRRYQMKLNSTKCAFGVTT